MTHWHIIPPMVFAAFWLGCGSDTDGGGGSAANPTTTSTATGAGGAGPLGATCSVVGSDVFTSDATGSTPSLAANGDHYALTWVNSAGNEVFLAILDENGNRLTYRSAATGANLQQPTIYRDGSGYMLLWSESGAIMSARVNDRGLPIAGGTIDFANPNVTEPRARGAVSSSGFLSAWDKTTNGALGLFSNDGELIRQVELPGSPAFPVPVSDGTSSAVFWSSGATIAFAKLDSSLNLSAPSAIPGQATNKVATARAGEFYVAWEDVSLGAGSETVFVAVGGASKGVRVPTEGGSANWPAITAAGDFIAVAYYQFRDGPPAIYLSLFTPELTRAGQDLQASPNGEAARFPSIAFAGGHFGIAYAQKDGPVKLSLADCK
jgi:hypothetical protein